MMALSAKLLKFPPGITCPVLIAVGENDELFPEDSAKGLLNEIDAKDKTMLVIPGAKHADYPPGSWTEVLKWLKTHYSQ